MRVIFTKNSSPLSILIRWVFREPVSHTAFVFDADRWLIQSNLFGVNIHWMNQWAKKNQIIYSVKYEMSLEQEEAIFQGFLDQYADAPYDFGAFFLFGWHGLKHRLFGSPIPPRLTEKTNGFLCTEVAAMLPESLTGLSPEVDLRVVTPFQLYEMLISKRDLE